MPFAALLAALAEVPDPRRVQGQRHSTPHLLLFSVLATLAGTTSQQELIAFIAAYRDPRSFWTDKGDLLGKFASQVRIRSTYAVDACLARRLVPEARRSHRFQSKHARS